jgi:hypothetical protein
VYTYDSTGGNTETPYTRAIRVVDIGSGHRQVMVESRVTWVSPRLPGTQEVIARTTLQDITATSTTP